jgi:hypothetical protein
VLLARKDYDPLSPSDVAPDASVSVLRVDELGAYGLSNAGERLSLFAPSGLVVSSVPPLAARAGQSTARRTPSCPDTEDCFGRHGDSGASPGAPNVLEGL